VTVTPPSLSQLSKDTAVTAVSDSGGGGGGGGGKGTTSLFKNIEF
jgi:hypothetical protein